MRRYRQMFWPTVVIFVILLVVLCCIIYMRTTVKDIIYDTITLPTEQPKSEPTESLIYPPRDENIGSIKSELCRKKNIDKYIGPQAITPDQNLGGADNGPAIIQYYNDQDTIYLAKIMHAEALITYYITGGPYEMSCVGWCVLNRLDSEDPDFIGYTSIPEVILAEGQFASIDDIELQDWEIDLARYILEQWNTEKNTGLCDGRVLPSDYLFFHGDGSHNYFRKNFIDNGEYYTYWMDSPYNDWRT